MTQVGNGADDYERERSKGKNRRGGTSLGEEELKNELSQVQEQLSGREKLYSDVRGTPELIPCTDNAAPAASAATLHPAHYIRS